MSKTYKIKEVRMRLESGEEIVAEVDSIEGIRTLSEDLANAGLAAVRAGAETDKPAPKKSRETSVSENEREQDPITRVETKAGLSGNSLSKGKVLAFKDEIPQLLRPGAFSNVTDAVIALVFAVEAGLQQSSVDYEAFKGLYEGQNIKSGSPLRVLLSNLRNQGYLDKKKYAADKSVSLTAKGETKAIEVLKEQCAS